MDEPKEDNSPGREPQKEPEKEPPQEPHKAPLGLRTVAVFEFAKGAIVLVAGLGLLSLIHTDVQSVAEEIVRSLHMNPARRYPKIFIEAASKLKDAQLWAYSMMALMYAVVRFVETYGLWHERSWAEWFAVVSASLWMPLEVVHLIKEPTWVNLGILIVNLIIVIYLGSLLAAAARKKKK